MLLLLLTLVQVAFQRHPITPEKHALEIHALKDPQQYAPCCRCLGPAETRPTARESLEDPFFTRRMASADSQRRLASGAEADALERPRRNRGSVDSEGDPCEVLASPLSGQPSLQDVGGRVKPQDMHGMAGNANKLRLTSLWGCQQHGLAFGLQD